MALGQLHPDPEGEFMLPPARYLVHLLFQIFQRRLTLLDEALDVIGLNGSKWRVLYGVWRLDGCTMSELARITGIDRTTLTRAVDRLVEEGMIERAGSPTDRRQVCLTATASGVEAYHRAQAVQVGTAQHLLAGIEVADQRAVCRLLERMLVNTVKDPVLARDIMELKISAREA